MRSSGSSMPEDSAASRGIASAGFELLGFLAAQLAFTLSILALPTSSDAVVDTNLVMTSTTLVILSACGGGRSKLEAAALPALMLAAALAADVETTTRSASAAAAFIVVSTVVLSAMLLFAKEQGDSERLARAAVLNALTRILAWATAESPVVRTQRVGYHVETGNRVAVGAAAAGTIAAILLDEGWSQLLALLLWGVAIANVSAAESELQSARRALAGEEELDTVRFSPTVAIAAAAIFAVSAPYARCFGRCH